MKRGLYVWDMARAINKLCEEGDYFYACGLIKETLNLWRSEMVMAFLCDEAKQMARHYLEETI